MEKPNPIMDKKYQVVCYLRIEPETIEPLTYHDVIREKESLELMQPENIYRIEKIEGDQDE